MASNQAFADYVCDQLKGIPGLHTKKMFGEFAVLCDLKVVALICDNQLFVKPTEAGRALLKRVTEAPPYKGAKNYLLLDEQLDDATLLKAIIEATERELPLPKPKAKPQAKPKTKPKTKSKAKSKRPGTIKAPLQ